MTSPDRRFVGHLKTIEWTRAKIERLFVQGLLVRRDAECVYEGLYLDAISSFELSIEELFFQILTGQFLPKGVVARVTFHSNQVVRDVLLGERKYLDWLPYERTEKRAIAFLRAGEPFTRLGRVEKSTIEDSLIIRNAIAHKSYYSNKRFQQLIDSYLLLPKERTPAGFLRSKIDPTTTRYQFYIAEMARIMQLLCR
jgi:hypothetical protein